MSTSLVIKIIIRRRFGTVTLDTWSTFDFLWKIFFTFFLSLFKQFFLLFFCDLFCLGFSLISKISPILFTFCNTSSSSIDEMLSAYIFCGAISDMLFNLLYKGSLIVSCFSCFTVNILNIFVYCQKRKK